MRFSSS
ncbi:hypothetical protein AB6A40_011171 [Gnathostoma spinigerum]